MKTICAFILGILLMLPGCGAKKPVISGTILPESDDPKIIAEQYQESFAKWQRKNIRAYTMVFRYGAFSPFAGIWEIDVADRQTKRRVFEGSAVGEETQMMANLNMERLYNLAAPATNAKPEGPFIIQARFFQDGGVALVRRVVNPAAAGSGPRDANWSYEVREVRSLSR
ncbi:MAG: hypothetical protein LBC99_03500 [Spirochaetota bacterium]|nr:hypothetical protein [Spirochaetota bacterium]